ncbi:MAG: VOC family protein [Alkalibacterium sp.]|nr:VOC family protein [Alkalibacterium sp.]
MNRLNLVCLGVRNMRQSLAFYKHIGFKTVETHEDPPIVFFNNQGSKLELYSIEELAKDINEENPPEYSKGGFSGITLACNMKTKEEVDQVMDQVKSAGGEIMKTPQIVSWGGYSGYFRDLDGYYWEVAYADSWAFDDQDMLIVDES